jgi:predicted MFS family arabinose efflux permease
VSAQRTISNATVALFAVAGGIAVANVYYLQPLLQLIVLDFHASAQSVGLVSVMVQAGYALGILAFVPLGDLVQPRPLVCGMFATVAVMLGLAASAPTVTLLGVAAFAFATCTTCAQILLPYGADLADPASRGRIVGTIQTGLITGTLVARAGGGLVGARFGWRTVLWCAAVLCAGAAIALWRAMPQRPPRATVPYRALIASILGMIVRYAPLRVSMGLGALAFAAFAAIWTVLAFHLHELGYGSAVAGGIGALSIVSAFAARYGGALADRRGTLFTGTAAWLILVVAMLTFATLGWTLPGIVCAAVIFPLGMSLTQLSNQIRIFSLNDEARSRLNTAYMFAIFTGGALGATAATLTWARAGWNGTCVLLLALVIAMAPLLWWYRTDARATAVGAFGRPKES